MGTALWRHLLCAACIAGAALLAAALGFTDFLGDGRVRRLRAAWLHMAGNLTAVLLAAVNFYLRATGDAGSAIPGPGVWLSGLVVALLLFNGWMGWELVYKHQVGVADAAADRLGAGPS